MIWIEASDRQLMLIKNRHISKIEHRVIFALASALFLLRIIELVISLIFPETIVARPELELFSGRPRGAKIN